MDRKYKNCRSQRLVELALAQQKALAAGTDTSEDRNEIIALNETLGLEEKVDNETVIVLGNNFIVDPDSKNDSQEVNNDEADVSITPQGEPYLNVPMIVSTWNNDDDDNNIYKDIQEMEITRSGELIPVQNVEFNVCNISNMETESNNTEKTTGELEIAEGEVVIPLQEIDITEGEEVMTLQDTDHMETELNEIEEMDTTGGELTSVQDKPQETNDVGTEFDNAQKEEPRKSKTFPRREKNRALRMKGKKYKALKRIENSYIEVERKARMIKPKTCAHGLKNTKKIHRRSFMCGTISEKQRRLLFEMFWNMDSWNAKKAYIKGLVDFRCIIRRRKEINQHTARKRNGYDCYLPNDDGIRVRVCRSFFLSTFDLHKDSFAYWVQDDVNVSDSSNSSNSNNEYNVSDENEASTSDLVIRQNAKKKETRKITKKQLQKRNVKREIKIKKLKSESVTRWLNLLPKMPSHYCRSSTSRIYVEPTFMSISHMHKIYKQWCTETQNASVERKMFCQILEQEKISIFKPRKDQCDTCVAFKTGNISQEEYDLHVVKKDEARAAKQAAIASCSNTTIVATMDMQSVLLCPKLLVSKQYYKQKLQVHNFTFYINNNKDVHCYVWHEADGSLSSTELTTCIMDFVQKVAKDFNKVILISDGCSYQNKNRVLSSALADYTKKSPEFVIEQIYLEKGHTMMEVDSVHSSLEHYFKPPIFAPSDYINRMRQARSRQPYLIHQLDYTFFKNYENLPSNYTSIRPGKKVGDPTVTDIRSLLYQNGTIFYKLRHTEEYLPLPQRRTNVQCELSDLYSEPLKIEKSKYDALQSLKDSMHRDYHSFYDNLHY